MFSHFSQPFKKTLNLPSNVLKTSIIHLFVTQKASLAGGYSENMAILKCKGILVKKKEIKKEITSSDGSGSYVGILLLVRSFPGIVTTELE